jgi:hypothetical protein
MASPLTGHALVFAICVALCRGAILMTPSFSVGPYRTATDSDEASGRFACLDLTGGPKPPYDTWTVPGSVGSAFASVVYCRVTLEAEDWSAFGAASAFVDRVGEGHARLALLRVELARLRGATPSKAA